MSEQALLVALIAHDQKKANMIRFVREHVEVLKKCRLIATGTTGRRVTEETGLQAHYCLSGPMGGDQQIDAQSVGRNVNDHHQGRDN